jgi:hypothetical protein
VCLITLKCKLRKIPSFGEYPQEGIDFFNFSFCGHKSVNKMKKSAQKAEKT